MALDRDEMNQRRQRREEMRQKQLQQQRKLQIRLIIAAAVIIVCGAAIFALSRNGGSEASAGESTPTGIAVTE